jgi:hypothetical protein
MSKPLRLREVAFSRAASDATAALQATDAAQPISTFVAHATEIEYLLNLPAILTYLSLFGERRLALWTRALVKTKHVLDYSSETAKAEVYAEVERMWADSKNDEQDAQSKDQEVDRRLEALHEVSEVYESLQALLRSAISAMWTALEYLASDLWITAVNKRPKTLGQRAIGQISNSPDGVELSAHAISFRILAERDFDLRSCLGTVLKPAFDFTRVEGIQRAYRCLFGKDDVTLCLGGDTLKELQIHRNLLVHKAGIVDAPFKAVVKTPVKIGERMLYDGPEACRLADTAIQSAARLATLVGEWLTNNPDPA